MRSSHPAPVKTRGLREPGMRLMVLALAALAPFLMAASPRWKPITIIEQELESHPEAVNDGALVLLREGQTTVSEQGFSTTEVYVRIKIIGESGKAFAKVQIPYNRWARIGRVHARTVTPDGRAVELPRNYVFEEQYSDHLGSRVKVFSMPAVEVGSILEYQYKYNLDGAYFFRPWTFSDVLFTLKSRYTFTPADTIVFKTGVWNVPAGQGEPEVIQSRWKPTSYVWEISNLPAIRREPHGFPFERKACHLTLIPAREEANGRALSVVSSWKELGDLLLLSYDFTLRGMKETGKIAKRLGANPGEPGNLEVKIFDYATGMLRLIDYPGVGGTHRTVDEIMKSGIADPEELTLVVSAMLRENKIPHRMILVRSPSYGSLNESFPSPYQFHRLILAVSTEYGTRFFDPAAGLSGSSLLRYDAQSPSGLLLEAGESRFVRLPEPRDSANREENKLNLNIRPDGTVTGKAVQNFTGQVAARLDRAVRGAKTDSLARALESLQGHRYRGLRVKKARVTHLPGSGNAELALEFQFEAEISGTRSGQVLSFVPPCLQRKASDLFEGSNRTQPIRLDYGFHEIDESVTRLPDSWSVISLPKNRTIDTSFGSYRLNYSLEDNAIICRRERVVRGGEFPAGQAESLAAFFREIAEVDRVPIQIQMESERESFPADVP